MKNFVLVVALIFGLTTFIGCNKKKKEEAEEMNAVTTENVVSVDNSAMPAEATNAIPVVVDNAAAAAPETADSTVTTSTGDTDKPTPKLIQQALKNAGFYEGKVDGELGPRTKKAIEAFQSQNGLKADGKVGRKTWKSLSAYLNKPAEVANPSADTQAVPQ